MIVKVKLVMMTLYSAELCARICDSRDNQINTSVFAAKPIISPGLATLHVKPLLAAISNTASS